MIENLKVSLFLVMFLLSPGASYAESIEYIYSQIYIPTRIQAAGSFIVPINMDPNKKPVENLYLIDQKVIDSKIKFKNIEKRNYYTAYDKAVYLGGENKYKAISTKNYDELNKYVYERVKVGSNEEYKEKLEWVKGLIKKNYPAEYGVRYDELTQKACKNKFGSMYLIADNAVDRLYYFSATCTDYGHDGYTGKRFSALFRINKSGDLIKIWDSEYLNKIKLKISAYWYSIGTDYIADLDKDGNPEVLLSVSRNLSSDTYLVELTGDGEGKLIQHLFSHFEGEDTHYRDIDRYTKMIYGQNN